MARAKILSAAAVTLFAAGVWVGCSKDETPPSPPRDRAEPATTRPASRPATRPASRPASRPARTAAQARIESIIADVKSKDLATRIQAEGRLSDIGYAIGRLDGVVSGPNAVDTDIVWKADEVVPVLTRALGDQSEHVQASAAETLGRIGPAAKDAAGALAQSIEKGGSSLRIDAKWALKAITGIEIPPAKGWDREIQLLIDALRYRYYRSGWAQQALYVLDKADSDRLPDLLAAIRKQDVPLRKAAAVAWGQLGALQSRLALRALRDALKDEDPTVRECAVVAMGRRGIRAAPALAEALRDEVPAVRIAAVTSMRSMAPVAPVALTAALRDPVTAVRSGAVLAIARSRVAPKDAVGPLIAALQGDDPAVRKAAAVILARCGPDAKGAVGQLTRLLKDDDPALRAVAADALAGIGPAAASAARALGEVVRKDTDLLAALAADEALKKIRQKP